MFWGFPISVYASVNVKSKILFELEIFFFKAGVIV